LYFTKRKHCISCFFDELRRNGIQDKHGFFLYKNVVNMYTNITLKHFNVINIEKRSREWHLDHKFSMYEGFKNNIPPYIIGSYINLEIISNHENTSKQSKCSLTKYQLFKQYNNLLKETNINEYFRNHRLY
jgi:hypothetical protein